MKKSRMLSAAMAIVLVIARIDGSHAQCCGFTNSGQNLGQGHATFGVAIGDLNNDTYPDAFTVDAYLDLEIYFNNGFGDYTLHQTIVPGSGEQYNYGVTLADIDNDNDPDAIVAPYNSSSGLKIYKNDGAGNFAIFQALPSGTASRYLGVGDLDGDGDKDIFMPATSSSNSKVYLNSGTGFFIAGPLVLINAVNDVALADVDGDNDLDAILATDNNQAVQIYLNNGSGVFINSGQILGVPSENYFAVAAADLDNDGDKDFAAGGMYDSLRIFLNNGSGLFTQHLALYTGNYDLHMKIADYNNDSLADIFVSTYGNCGLEVWKNRGGGDFELCYMNAAPMPQVYAHGFDLGRINNDYSLDVYMGQYSNSDGDKVFYGNTGPVISIDIFDTICPGLTYTFPDSATSATACVHVSQFTSSFGCDSNITSHLAVEPVNVTVLQNVNTLTAQTCGAAYQWLDCDNAYAVIPMDTGQSFSPSSGGNFAVQITKYGCTDTSTCVNLVYTGVEKPAVSQFYVYPNPAEDIVFIESSVSPGFCEVNIFDIYGRLMRSISFANTATRAVSLKGLLAGIYIVRVSANDKITESARIIKR